MKRTVPLMLVVALLGAPNAYASDVYRGGLTDAPATLPPGYDPILGANNQFSVQFVTTNFDYAEKMNGILLDTEKNWVPGIGAELSVMSNFLVSNAYLDVSFSYLNGQTDYVGGYISPPTPYGSVIAKSGAEVSDLDLRLGKGFVAYPHAFMITPFVGLGFHEWNRGVNAGEIYSHGYAGGGALIQWAPADRLVLSVNGLVGSTFASYIIVNPVGPFPGFSGNLGDSLIYKVGGGVDYAFTNAFHASTKVEYTDFSYGHSAVYGCCLEPDSTSKNLTVKVGIGYSWGGDYYPLK